MASRIIDNLYLGDIEIAQHCAKKKINIKVISCAIESETPNDYKISLYNGYNVNLEQKLRNGAEKINQLLNQGNKVLVHCTSGVSRSPTLVIYYLMVYKNITYNESYRHVRNRHPIINPNHHFTKFLSSIRS